MRDVATKIAGASLSSGDYNASQAELENIVTNTGQTLDAAGGPDTDQNQLGQAVAAYASAAWGYQESGTANAHVAAIATTLKAVKEYYDNMFVAYIPSNTNTNSTVTTNISTLGAKNIRLVGGALPAIGELRDDRALLLKYNDGAGYFEVVSGGDNDGITQEVYTQTGAVATGTTVIPYDDTIPQITEGDEYLTRTITPKRTTDIFRIDVVLNISSSVANNVTGALFQDSTADALCAAGSHAGGGGNEHRNITMTYFMVAGSLSLITFRVRAGGEGAGTTTINGSGGARKYGGALISSIAVTGLQLS